jgi:hypothetical protein
MNLSQQSLFAVIYMESFVVKYDTTTYMRVGYGKPFLLSVKLRLKLKADETYTYMRLGYGKPFLLSVKLKLK